MPVPPPPPPPPPTLSQANTEKPALTKSELSGRNALLSDISKGRKLKKAVTNDRSGPILDKPKTLSGGGGVVGGSSGGLGGGGGGGGGGGFGGPPGLGGLFQGGMPKLRSTGSRENESVGSRPPILPPGGRTSMPKPFVPQSGPSRGPAPPMGLRTTPETQRNRMPPPPRNDISPRSENAPPSVHSFPRPMPSSLHNRGPPPVPGGSRQMSPVSAPPIPPPSTSNRVQGFAGTNRQMPPSVPPSVPSMNRPPPPQTHSRGMEDRPLPPPAGNRPSLGRDMPPPPPPQNNKPPVPSTPRPMSSSQPPPLPPGRPGPPPPLPPTPSPMEDMPRLPHRNLPLAGAPPPALPPARSGHPPPPPPPNERPPPPVRDPPGRSGQLLPPPPVSRNGIGSKGPSGPQPPSRGNQDSQRSGARPPPPPERPGLGPLPPPPPPSLARNGFQDSFEDEWERRFSFHPLSDLPPPDPFIPVNKTYPSKLVRGDSRSGSTRKERGAPPLPPIPR
ncbi:WAS/WASL-interacting protein family member 1 [Spea bombifrons]|uniref:WAS/WASL-interacting protein family member 1 n=1 Tax=Spea bombifrons TaxID=233779 RepID=UPI00234BD3DF|nr:WAS/WASL-interacting protein family member 1 [Spea bombifrons]XP_053327445.1 WAS/WASL-interacting protein family member 1 [Spea bombifrons]